MSKKESKEAPEYMTVNEVAVKVRRSAQTVRRWIHEGKMFDRDSVVRVRDGYLINTEEVKRLLKASGLE